MQVIEYGAQHKDTIILLHGGGLCWWNYRAEAERLQEKYHVVLPILDGHAGSDAPFTTIEQNAEELIQYINAHFGGSVLAMGGLSLGGQVLAEVLARRGGICRYAVLESALAVPMPFTHRLIKASVTASYGLISKPWFARLQFEALHIKQELYPDYYRDSCGITLQSMVGFLQANTAYKAKAGLHAVKAKTIVLVGGKEQKQMRQSAQMLHEAIPGSTLHILPGYTHGDLSLNHPDEYITMLQTLTQ